MEEKRFCPREIRPVPFLVGGMGSMVSDAAKARQRHPERSLEVMRTAGRDWPADTPTAEEGLIASEDEEALVERAAAIKRQVLGLFDDDLVAQTIAEGIMDGLDGEDLRTLTELDKTAFA